MSGAEEVKFSLRVLINKQKTKVLFAEADGDFLDVLLSFLMLPLGKIVKVLEKHYGDKAPVVGSLTTLYNGLANCENARFWTELGKQVLFNPRSSSENEFSSLKVNVDYTLPVNYDCTKPYDGVFTKSTASFLIGDNLWVRPNVESSVEETLSDLGLTIADMDGVEIRNVTFGFNEIMDLLKGSLVSQTPLSDLVLGDEREVDFATVDSEGVLSRPIGFKYASNKEMSLRIMVQKSSNKLLFAQADKGFVGFLFSILAIPLGRVEYVLGGETCLLNIDYLYQSIAYDSIRYSTLVRGSICSRYFSTSEIKDRLIKPKLHQMYASDRFLNLTSKLERRSPSNHLFPLKCEQDLCPPRSNNDTNFVKGPRMHMVTDDLTVTPLGIASSLSILNEMKIPLSDVEELDMHIGEKEALRILKASLTSTSALTDALINPMLTKELDLQEP